jgi:hypothetical protein
VSADQVAQLQARGWIHSTTEGMWEHPDRVEGPVSLPDALEVELGEGPDPDTDADA